MNIKDRSGLACDCVMLGSSELAHSHLYVICVFLTTGYPLLYISYLVAFWRGDLRIKLYIYCLGKDIFWDEEMFPLFMGRKFLILILLSLAEISIGFLPFL